MKYSKFVLITKKNGKQILFNISEIKTIISEEDGIEFSLRSGGAWIRIHQPRLDEFFYFLDNKEEESSSIFFFDEHKDEV